MNLIPNIDVAVDINSLAPVFIDHILHVNDTNSRTFSFTLYANNQKISLYSGNFTAKAAISVNNILLDDDVTALIQTDSTVAVTVDNKYLTLIPGVMRIQLTITGGTGGTDVIVTPLPILARVTSDLAQTAQILPDSHSSYSEIVAEIVAARGDYDNLTEAIGSKVTFVETADPDNATQNGVWYKVHTNSDGDYALFAISTTAQQAQFRITSTGTIGIRRRYLSNGAFPAWGAFDRIGWKGSEIDDMIATYLASVKAQTITAQSTHDQIPTAKAVYDYAASKASYTYLNNQYTQLVNDVAQLPATADVQQMIDSLVDPTLSVQGKAADAKATGDKLDGVPFDLTFTVNDVINNFVVVEDGKLRWNESWCSTDYCYVPLENGGTIEITSSIIGGGGLAFYDYNKTCLRYITGNNASEYDYTPASMPQTRVFAVPKNTSYIRISAHKQPSSDMSRVSLLRIRKGVGLNQVVNELASLNAGKESTANKVTSINANSTDAQYPSAKAVYTAIQTAIQNAIGGVINGQY